MLARRNFLRLAAFAPVMPHFMVRSAQALDRTDRYGGNVLVIVRMIGGNDGLNAVIPVQDDHYYKGRPTISIPKPQTLALAGSDLALHPALGDLRWLIDQGLAGIVQNVGYSNSSRSHTRSTEIWETGSVSDQAQPEGWLGRYLDQLHEAGAMTGVEFGADLSRTLVSNSHTAKSIANPRLLIQQNLTAVKTSKNPASALDQVRVAQNELAWTGAELRNASKGTGSLFRYADTAFGESLRWTGNMIERGSPTRLFYITLGSFDSGFSFDTHLNQLAAHHSLYTEFSTSLRAFAEHLKKAGALSRVQLLTFSDFGRQIGENGQGGTDHGDASILFALGGKMRAGLLGEAPDLAAAYDGGLKAKLDFRQIYANVLERWLHVDAKSILGETPQPYSLLV